ncbi:hypothetical protein ABZ942_41070 [Nocardia sp. NPDC046473]|uniref:hypothetical protein n=1 Tax=Nocardia sp. NPDC046473 TaxID=3155733 RepID=UPI00340058AE
MVQSRCSAVDLASVDIEHWRAKLYEDHRTPEGPDCVTLLDLEGNEFCVERSAVERGF